MGGNFETTTPENHLEAPLRQMLPDAGVWRPYLELMRPANLLTAAADVLAGFAVAGLMGGENLPFLLASTMCLYAGGVVLNDVFDARIDALERPERPIPAGRADRGIAARLGVLLLLGGVAFAILSGPVSALLAASIALLAAGYDAWGKHRPLLGPLNMGLCRGLNLLLGVSAVPALLSERWPLALFPIAYIGAITAISRGEVHGGRREVATLAMGLLAMVLLGLPSLTYQGEVSILAMMPFLVLLAVRVWPRFWLAWRSLEAPDIRRAVKAGVLSLILLDATLAAGYAGFWFGLMVAGLSIVAGRISRAFAVT